MNTHDITGKVFMIGLPSAKFDDQSKKVLEAVKPGSVILFGRNIINRNQVKKYIESISAFLGYKPLIAIDQEGGIVTRLTDGFTISPGAMAIASTGNRENAYRAGKILGSEMKAVGIDWDLAPVVDINNNPLNPAIGIRSFSDRKDVVIDYSSKFAKGLSDSGIITCLKHFPGNGRVVTDPHLDMPILNISRDEIYNTELTPFFTLDAPSWMPTHIYVPALQTSKEPITVSKEILTEMIRNELKYDGVLIADDLNMGGVSNFYKPEDIAFKTLEAGMDMVSFCDNSEKQMRVKSFIEKKFNENNSFAERITNGTERIDKLFELRRANENQGASEAEFIENAIIMDRISADSVKVLKNRDNLIPINRADNIFAVKPARLVLVENNREGLPSAVTETGDFLNCPITIYNKEISKEESDHMLIEAEGKRNIIFTENSHLSPSQVKFIRQLALRSSSLILVAMRNPYDADIEGIENALCSFGYNRSQQYGILHKLLLEYNGESDK